MFLVHFYVFDIFIHRSVNFKNMKDIMTVGDTYVYVCKLCVSFIFFFFSFDGQKVAL